MERKENLAELAARRIEELCSNQEFKLDSLEDDELLQKYQSRLAEIRKEGSDRIAELRQSIAAAQKNKMLEDNERRNFIIDCRNQIAVAKEFAAAHAAEERRLIKDALFYADALARKYTGNVNASADARAVELQAAYEDRLREIRAESTERFTTAATKAEQETIRYECKTASYEAKLRYQTELNRCSDAKKLALAERIQENRAIRNGRTNLAEDLEFRIKSYLYEVRLSKVLLDCGPNLAILVFFAACIIIAPLNGSGNLLSLPNIFTILEISSTNMFYALGAAGIILIAGTDLSLGRMVAMGSVIAGIILHPGTNIVSVFGLGPWDFSPLATGLRLLLALCLPVWFCTLFSAASGFCSAKLHIHPFISTLSTQLVIYGLLFFGTEGSAVGSIDSSLKDLIGGRWVLGIVNGELITFPKLIIPAAGIILATWFIWNKTTFGKNLYAVGGNAQAAEVCGINVFAVTMGVFIMAGIYYGCGSFLEAFRSNASAGTGQGYELNAIAACVVGGMSLNGGRGKVSGVVGGVITFNALTYCLTFLHIDTNLQFVCRGLLIITAVAQDSIKNMKRL